MALSGYISEILKYETNLRLAPTEVDFLQRIAQGKCSAYRIHSELKDLAQLSREECVRKKIRIFPRTNPECVGKSMAYKNVHRILQKLQKLHLIKEVESKRFSGVHRANYYTITSKGIFYLIYFKRFFLRVESLVRG